MVKYNERLHLKNRFLSVDNFWHRKPEQSVPVARAREVRSLTWDHSSQKVWWSYLEITRLNNRTWKKNITNILHTRNKTTYQMTKIYTPVL